ncbi:MAG TPA: hypothetical protein VE972_13295 [Conexibacter sp.]|nr:hypothetical protein [Conexibacter sp.]
MRLIHARLPIAILVAAALGLALAAGAPAAVTGVTVTTSPSTTQSGAHPDLQIQTDFTYDSPLDSAQDVTLHLGPGLIGSPAAAATCDQATFLANGACPVGSVVGTDSLNATAFTPAPTPVALSGEVYNLDVPAGDTTHLAFLGLRLHTSPTTSLNEISAVTTSPVDLGNDALLENLPNSFGPAPLTISRISLTLFGAIPGRDAFFMTNPTQCRIPASTRVTANSHGAPGTSLSGDDSYLATDCATEPFTGGGLLTQLSTTRTDSPASIGVTVTQPPDPKPSDAVTRHNAHVLQSTTVLPQGVAINPAAGTGLEACSAAQFAQGDAAHASTCPAASRIATASFVAPVVGKTFTGPVYLGTQPNDTFRLLVDVAIPGARLKLVGHVRPDRSNGRITTVFDNLPQIPFTQFGITFNGGSRSILSTPPTCGSHRATSSLVPYTRTTTPTPPDDSASTTFSTSYDGAGAACLSIFKPYFNGALSNTKAGGTGSYSLTLARPDRNTQISTAAIKLPAGLVGSLKLSGLTRCTLSVAGKGRCPASSKVGTASVEVGVGPDPATLPGTVFLTKHRVKGDPAALSVLVPATLGPIDLGLVVLPVRLQLRSNGGLTATTSPLPLYQAGVPTAVRLATITLDRAGFMRNPTSCGRKRYSTAFAGVGGATATTHAALTISDCDKLGFKPKIAVTLGAKGATGRSSHPPLTTTVTQGKGQAAIKRVHVRLPLALSTNLTSVNAACTQTDFAAGTCAKSAKVATATAVSPLIPSKVTGPVYLVRRDKGLPKLVVQLRSPIALQFEGFVNVGNNGAVGTTFPAVPDLAVTRFVLKFHGGRDGALTATRNLCTKQLHFPTDFTGQNGKTSRQRPRITVPGCKR